MLKSLTIEYFQSHKEGARYLLICQDTYDASDYDRGLYSHYCRTAEEARQFSAKEFTNFNRLMEVIDLTQDLKSQLAKPRKKNLDDLEWQQTHVLDILHLRQGTCL